MVSSNYSSLEGSGYDKPNPFFTDPLHRITTRTVGGVLSLSPLLILCPHFKTHAGIIISIQEPRHVYIFWKAYSMDINRCCSFCINFLNQGSIFGQNKVKVKCAEEQISKFQFAHHQRPPQYNDTPKNMLSWQVHISSLQNAQIFISDVIFRFFTDFIVQHSLDMDQ